MDLINLGINLLQRRRYMNCNDYYNDYEKLKFE
jgi:hypothetical protein